MHIVLSNDDIEQAIIAHVASLGFASNNNTSVELTAGRGPNGYSATVKFDEEVVLTEDTTVKVSNKKEEKPKAAKAKPQDKSESKDISSEPSDDNSLFG